MVLIEDPEEAARMMNQAKLGDLSRRFVVRRCWLQSRTRDSSGEGPPMKKLTDLYPGRLQKHENGWVARIDDIMVGGFVNHFLPYSLNGVIEAHVNGFEIHILHERLVIMHYNVEWCFYGSGNEMQPPLLQFHLKHPIKIHNSETKNIQIRLMSGRYKHMERVEDLKNFIHKVEESQRTCESELDLTTIDFQALDEFQFDAADHLTGAPTTCALTRYALVVLLKEPAPYLVVPLREIQFVNLACFGDGIEMTVVFYELERDVFQLRSIPLGYLTEIKHRLNRADVKYYVNSLRPDWSDKLRLYRELWEVFLAGGGWDFLEDSLTLAKYPDFDPQSVRDGYDRAREDIKNRMRKIVRVDPKSLPWFRVRQSSKT